MDAVGDRADGPLVLRHTRPDRAPHVPGHLSVQLADGVGGAGRPQRERRHVEQRTAAIVVMTKRHEGVPV